jgi:hypothetical protein
MGPSLNTGAGEECIGFYLVMSFRTQISQKPPLAARLFTDRRTLQTCITVQYHISSATSISRTYQLGLQALLHSLYRPHMGSILNQIFRPI